MPRHHAVLVAEIGFSAVLAEGLVRAFIGATDGGLSLRRIEIGRQIGARIIHPLGAGLIPGVLSHASPDVSEQHYNLARSVEASRRFAAHLSRTRAKLRPVHLRSEG